MVSDSDLQRVKANSPHLLQPVLETVNLIDYPFKVFTNNATLCLQSALQNGTLWHNHPGRPWVAWRWTNINALTMRHWASTQLFLLTMPGTPSLDAGQEIGRVSKASITVCNSKCWGWPADWYSKCGGWSGDWYSKSGGWSGDWYSQL